MSSRKTTNVRATGNFEKIVSKRFDKKKKRIRTSTFGIYESIFLELWLDLFRLGWI